MSQTLKLTHPHSIRAALQTRPQDVLKHVAGSHALVRERSPKELHELFSSPPAQGGVWLALDCVQDPHNVGAIFRTAAFFGVRGIVLIVDRSAHLTATVYDVASGGVEFVPFTFATNLRNTIDEIKKMDVWVLGTSEHASTPLSDVPRDRNWLLVLGNEEKGLRRLTLDSCDMACRIPPVGTGVTSLNVSVATGILVASLCSKKL